MTMYVLVEDETNKILEEVDGDKAFRSGVPPILKAEKQMRWLEFVLIEPAVNRKTQVKEGPTIDTTATHYTRTWTIRAKTKQELDSDNDHEASQNLISFKPLLTALNDGSFIPGSNYSNEQLQRILKEHL
jgi:hypothetical protein